MTNNLSVSGTHALGASHACSQREPFNLSVLVSSFASENSKAAEKDQREKDRRCCPCGSPCVGLSLFEVCVCLFRVLSFVAFSFTPTQHLSERVRAFIRIYSWRCMRWLPCLALYEMATMPPPFRLRLYVFVSRLLSRSPAPWLALPSLKPPLCGYSRDTR